ncbi:DUF4870 domain-containing protein [Peribacillus sp. SCS-155]|uniref:DUF4870 domain-containing protein n=1 Tax=Peribacillus sedimenti TaxID=3115297 RepID=UPI003905A9A0
MPTNEERILAALIYGISFFTAFIGPIVIWLLKKDDSKFVDSHGREYLNFLISYTVYGIITAVLCVVLIGFLIVPVLALAMFIFTIIAAIRAYEGKTYRIPFVFRIL